MEYFLNNPCDPVPCDNQSILNELKYNISTFYIHPSPFTFRRSTVTVGLLSSIKSVRPGELASGSAIERDSLLVSIFSLFLIIGRTHLSIISACNLGNEPSAMIGRTLLLLLLDLRTAHANRRHQVPTLFLAAHQHCGVYFLSPLSNTPDLTHQLIIRWANELMS